MYVTKGKTNGNISLRNFGYISSSPIALDLIDKILATTSVLSTDLNVKLEILKALFRGASVTPAVAKGGAGSEINFLLSSLQLLPSTQEFLLLTTPICRRLVYNCRPVNEGFNLEEYISRLLDRIACTTWFRSER